MSWHSLTLYATYNDIFRTKVPPNAGTWDLQTQKSSSGVGVIGVKIWSQKNVHKENDQKQTR